MHANTYTIQIKLKDFITKVGRPYQDIVLANDTTANVVRYTLISIEDNNITLNFGSNVPTSTNVLIDSAAILLVN